MEGPSHFSQIKSRVTALAMWHCTSWPGTAVVDLALRLLTWHCGGWLTLWWLIWHCGGWPGTAVIDCGGWPGTVLILSPHSITWRLTLNSLTSEWSVAAFIAMFRRPYNCTIGIRRIRRWNLSLHQRKLHYSKFNNYETLGRKWATKSSTIQNWS